MFCGCCGERMDYLYPDDDYYKEYPEIEAEWYKYLKEIKSVLDNREHVEK